MKNKSSGSELFQGFVEPLYYNSDGKTIGFIINSLCGNTVILSADHKLKRLRKSIGQKVSVIGSYCRERKIFKVKKIMSFIPNLDKTLL